MDLPAGFPDSIAVTALDVSAERASDINRTLRKQHSFSRSNLGQLLEGASVGSGWFFFGMPAFVGQPSDPVNVPEMLLRSAFAIDILDGRFLFVRTVSESVAHAVRESGIGMKEIDPCNLDEVRLAY